MCRDGDAVWRMVGPAISSDFHDSEVCNYLTVFMKPPPLSHLYSQSLVLEYTFFRPIVSCSLVLPLVLYTLQLLLALLLNFLFSLFILILSCLISFIFLF